MNRITMGLIAFILLTTGGPAGFVSAASAQEAGRQAPREAGRQTAQETSPRPPTASFGPASGSASFLARMDDRPRLGVYLRPGCQVGPTAVGACRVPPVVASVVKGAPADSAGLQPGDTLLAIDGVALHTEAGRRAMGDLEEGVPVRLRVGRGEGRRTVSLAPTARPATGLFRLSGDAWSSAPRSDVHVFRVQDDEGGVAEFYFTQPSGRRPAPDGFVMFGQGEDGTVRVDFGRPDVEIRAPDGRYLQLEELESHVRALEVPRPGPLPVPPQGHQAYTVELEVESVDGEAEVRRRVILENAPLARRLQTVHMRALSDARVRIDSVRRVQAALARRGELPPAAAAGYSYVFPRTRVEAPAVEAPRWSEALVAADHRLAGAEFRPLTPELAEYFSVDAGLLVLRVIPQTPAHRLGLRGGDVVVEVAGLATPDLLTFRHLVARAAADGSDLEVKWNRKGTELRGDLVSR